MTSTHAKWANNSTVISQLQDIKPKPTPKKTLAKMRINYQKEQKAAVDLDMLRAEDSFEKMAKVVNNHEIVKAKGAPDTDLLDLISPQSEQFNKNMLGAPRSVVDGKQLPFSSFVNKLNLFGLIGTTVGSEPGVLEEMVNNEVASDVLPYAEVLREHQKVIREKR